MVINESESESESESAFDYIQVNCDCNTTCFQMHQLKKLYNIKNIIPDAPDVSTISHFREIYLVQCKHPLLI